MVSVVVCSIDQKKLNDLKINIREKIGIKYELITLVNRGNKYGISEAYNIGASKAKYENLVFIHEDICFHTKNWGRIIVNLLGEEEIGLVGVAGTQYLSKYASSWVDVPVKYYRTNVIQRSIDGREETRILSSGEEKSRVVAVDGMFLALRKKVWSEFKFDQITFTGFHFYDLDISLRICIKYQLYVTHDILIEHFSQGGFNQDWYNDSIKFKEKWKKKLPLSCTPLPRKEIRIIEHYTNLKSLNYTTNFTKRPIMLLLSICRLFYYRPSSRLNFLVFWKIIRKIIS